MTVTEAPLPPVVSAFELTAPTEDTVSAKQEPRPYIVLAQRDESDPTNPLEWRYVAEIAANSAKQAIQKAVETPGTSFLKPEGATTLVAVPARSWNPVQVSVKTETSIVLS